MRANNGNGSVGPGGSSQYSTVPGKNTRQAANMMVNGGIGGNKPLATNAQRTGPNVRARNFGAQGNSGARGSSKAVDDVVDQSKAKGARNGSARRGVGAQAAAAYQAQGSEERSIFNMNKNGGGNNRLAAAQRVQQENVFEFTDNLMEKLGTPEMLIQELKMAKRDIETLKKQLEVKEKSLVGYRADTTKLKTENFDLKRQIVALKKQAQERPAANNAEQNEPVAAQAAAMNNGSPERENRRGAARENNPEAQMMAQLQMAIHMREVENRINERQMLMMAMHAGGGANQAQAEEDRLLQRAIEESKNDQQAQDPNNPDVDRMTYEQLMELGDNAGHVSRGYTQEEINQIKQKVWFKGRTQADACLICMENFASGKFVKTLKCGHEYGANCIDTWLSKEKRCPVCSQPPF